MAKQFTLGKHERLKSRKSIEKLFAEGKKFNAGSFRVIYLKEKSFLFPLQFGVGVSTANFKRAVDRNRIKRITRESYRLQKNVLYEKLKSMNSGMILFFIYTGKEIPEYKETYALVGKALNKLKDLLH